MSIIQSNRFSFALFSAVVFILLTTLPASAGQLSPEEEAARKASDPLGNIRAIMTDNTIAFDAGPNGNDTSYGFQIQPVYAIPTEKLNMLARAVLPILGLEPGVVAPPIGSEPRPDVGSTWGLSDSVVQYFFSPRSDGAWKWGIGPQVSLKTRTNDRLAGAGWGGGLAAVVFGGSGQWSYGIIGSQVWGEDNFSILAVQPTLIYMLKSLPGGYLGYNNSMIYDWEAASSNAFTLPLGLTFGKAVVRANGDFWDLSIGAYPLAVRPDDAPRWQLKLGVSYFFD